VSHIFNPPSKFVDCLSDKKNTVVMMTVKVAKKNTGLFGENIIINVTNTQKIEQMDPIIILFKIDVLLSLQIKQ
jgi:hypothetical protein